ncbi:hypothetical protein [Streptomyces sp. NPDC058240]|uniref:hypothetical protein n=1 Tax=Streptomyces sp. NPDC058240 TaxID=3346396 RepID=UPI0036F076FD
MPDASAERTGNLVNIVVIVQYARRTADGEYDAGKGKKIGVITAYCKGVTKCPNWINEWAACARRRSSSRRTSHVSSSTAPP